MGLANKRTKPIARRGRPRRGEPSGDQLRTQVIEQARSAYAAHGERELSVARILSAAQISRPTFYRLFRSASEVCEALIAEANEQLRACILATLMTPRDPLGQIRAVVAAYFGWANELGPMTHALYRDVAQPGTHANRAREQIIAEFVALLRQQAQLAGRVPPDPLLADAVLRALEYLCSSAFAEGAPAADEFEKHRLAAEQLVLGALLPDLISVPAAGTERGELT